MDKVRPIIKFSDLAIEQYNLIVKNDFTLRGKYLRLVISGKGCDGFKYSIGFTEINDDDVQIEINQNSLELLIIMDSFTAFYLTEVLVDYKQDFDNDTDGFVIQNLKQDEYKGKFWLKDETKIPNNLQ